MLPTAIATRPPGRPPNNLAPPNQLVRMTTKQITPITGVLNICAAGLIEMKVIAIPASDPSRAARGVIFRIYGPIRLPPISTKLCTNTQHNPAPHAANGSPVAILIGSMITKVTTNICGTDTPEGSAQTSVRPVFFARL